MRRTLEWSSARPGPVAAREPMLLRVLVAFLALASLIAPPLAPLRTAAAVLASATHANAASAPGLPLPVQSALSTRLGQDQPTYHARSTPSGWQAQNTAQQLALTFTSAGVRIESGAFNWELALSGYGTGETLRPLATVQPTAGANRVELAYAGLTQWFVNGPLGLQQGFTVAQPPAGIDGPLTLALTQRGNLRPSLEPDGHGLLLAGPNGEPVLRYSGLAAFDAGGRPLPAWLELAGGQVLVRVDDEDAQYPVTIDPMVQSAQLTAAGKAASDQLGWAVAMSGDTLVVSARLANPDGIPNAGEAYVYVRPAGGWTNMVEGARLTASPKAPNNQFGFSIDIDGDTIVVGAPYAASGVITSTGAAYVFVKPAGGWAGDLTPTATLTATDEASGAELGFAVAVSGDTVAASAAFADAGSVGQSGAAYVFVRPSGGWAGPQTEQAKLTASDKAEEDSLGWSVAINGDTVVAGAPLADVGSFHEDGAAYIFVRPPGGWAGPQTETTKLTTTAPGPVDYLGWAVAVSDQIVVSGAYFYDPRGTTDAGAAFVFVKPPGGWAGPQTDSAMLLASDRAEGDFLGWSAAIDGDTVIVGANDADWDGTADAGKAYVFTKPVSGWAGEITETTRLTPLVAATDGRFGKSVAISGGSLMVGSTGADPGGINDAGAVYAFAQKFEVYLPVVVSGH